MSQHDMTVDNGAGIAVRADINNAIKALVSFSSGASTPVPSFPCQMWADTGTGRLKRRDSANTLWLDMGVLDALGEIQTVASATLTDIASATSRVVSISGTTTITGFGSVVAGVTRTVRFLGSLILTHNATSLILPGGLNITTALNDTAEFLSLGSGNWICLRYNLANTKPAPTVGTVAQSGGSPSGSIIETATNGNGTYTKYADGTMICRVSTIYASTNIIAAAGSVFNGALAPSQSYPATFVGVPATSQIFEPSTGQVWAATTGLSTSTAWTAVYPFSQVSIASLALTLHRIAHGRWF